jgi:hypothetical protein
LESKTSHTIGAGAGLKAGYKLGPITPYIGVSLGGEVKRTETDILSRKNIASDSKTEFGAAVTGKAGVEVDVAGPVYIAAEVQATKPLSDKPTQLDVGGGLGVRF